MSFRTVTRNPNNIGGKIYCSSWQQMVVVFNGKLLDPEDYYEAKGSTFGLSKDGYVNFTAKKDGELVLLKDGGNVVDVTTKQIRGYVAIVRFSKNDCGLCQTTMRETDWYSPEVHMIKDNPNVLRYTEAQMKGHVRSRAMRYNRWVSEYHQSVGTNATMNPKPVDAGPDRTLPVIGQTPIAEPAPVTSNQRRTVVKSG